MYNGFVNYMPYQQQRQEVVQVSGEQGARAFQLPPNSSVLLLDNSAPLVWLKMTDGAGFPTITPYSITPYAISKEPTAASLEERIKRLEEIVNESNSCESKQN